MTFSDSLPGRKVPMDVGFYKSFGIYSAAGIQLAAAVVGGLLLGAYLDKKFDIYPWLTITGVVIGSVGGFWNFLKIVKKIVKISSRRGFDR